jgi:Tol biopolymer transport system component
MNELWADTFVEERNLAQNIFTLRKLLNKNKDGRNYIETVPKQGYRFVVEVRPIDAFEEEVIEVSLSQKTTVIAEGNISNEEVAEMIRTTADSVAFDQSRVPAQVKEIAPPKKSGIFAQFTTLSILATSIISFITIGAAIWAWKNSDASSTKESNSLANVEILNTNLKQLTNSGNAWSPSVSPDNKQIAYIFHENNKDSIRLKNLATGSVTESVPPTEAEIGQPIFSADGNYLFYNSRDGGNESTIYKTPIYGGSPQKIITNARSDIGISRDGKWLAFVRYDGLSDEYRLMICRTDGTDERILIVHKSANYFLDWEATPSWSFDGKKIALVSLNPLTNDSQKREYYVAEVDVETGEERKILVPEVRRIYYVAWLADGEHLFITAQGGESDTYQIWKIHRTNGEIKKVTNDLINYSRLCVSADGKVLLTNRRSEATNLAIVDVTSGSVVEELTSETSLLNGSNGLEWTPDGKQIVYAKTNAVSNGNIWKYDLETKQAKQLTFDERKRNWWAVITPDGESIYYTSNRSGDFHIWKMNIDGSNNQQVTDGKAEMFSEISPDGKWLIYLANNMLWRKPIQGGEPIKIMEKAGPSHVSPDSKQIVFHYFDSNENEKNAWKTGLKSFDNISKLEIIDIAPERSIYRWKPDGTGFYYANAARSQNNIWFYSIADKTSKQITNFENEIDKIGNMSVSPDGKQIAISEGSVKSEIIKITGF